MEQQLRNYLKRHKQDVMPATLLVAAIFLVWIIVLPQFNDVMSLRGKIETQTETNEGLESSQNVLEAIDDSQLDEDYELVLRALPTNKSISSIYSSLSTTALESNVTIGSLNLQVGSVYSQKQEELSKQRMVGGVPFLNMVVRVNGNSATDTTRFAQLLFETIPLVEIEEISVTDIEGRYDVDFFFKPINRSSFQAQTVIQPLSPAMQKLLTTLRSWDE